MRLDDEVVFNYRQSRAAFLRGDLVEAEIYYRQNRSNHAIELYYEVELQEHFMPVHASGTVLGRATYGDFLCVYQNVGVGSDLDGNRPVFGDGVVIFPGAKVLGKTKIGSNVFITANTVVQNVEIPDNSVVFNGVHPLWISDPRSDDTPFLSALHRPTKRSVIRDVFKVPMV